MYVKFSVKYMNYASFILSDRAVSSWHIVSKTQCHVNIFQNLKECTTQYTFKHWKAFKWYKDTISDGLFTIVNQSQLWFYIPEQHCSLFFEQPEYSMFGCTSSSSKFKVMMATLSISTRFIFLELFPKFCFHFHGLQNEYFLQDPVCL